jgi:hypothetical protein
MQVKIRTEIRNPGNCEEAGLKNSIDSPGKGTMPSMNNPISSMAII